MRLTSGIVLLAACLLAVAGCSSDGPTSGPPAPGSPAPQFELQRLEGDSVPLSGLRGRPVMLNFWATWCPPCREEMPYIQEIQESPKRTESGLVILAVNLAESPEDVADFMNSFGLTFTVLLDIEQKVARDYNVAAIPTTYFIDEDGIIRYVKIGTFRNVTEIDAILDSLINNVE